MLSFIRTMKADFLKLKSTSFYYIHIFIPILGLILFLPYYSFSSWNTTIKIQGYLEAIAIVFPLMIGLVTSMIIEQEAHAGNFKEMLVSPCGRPGTLLSKIGILLVSGLVSSIIALGGFGLGFEYILHQNILSISFYTTIILIMLGSQIFLYLFHIWLAFRFGNGVSIGVGIFESLFSALIITGLGTGIWTWFPCGWTIRLTNYWLLRTQSSGIYIPSEEINNGVRNSIIYTLLIILFIFLWFNHYEGREEK